MKRISEVLTEHIDEELNATYVDVYEVGSEEGIVAAVICNDTGKVFYRDYIWASYEQVTTAIQEVVDKVKKPRVAITISGGNFQDIVSSQEIDVVVIDFDTEGSSEDDINPVKDIPYSVEDNRTEKAYISVSNLDEDSVNPERVDQLFKIAKG